MPPASSSTAAGAVEPSSSKPSRNSVSLRDVKVSDAPNPRIAVRIVVSTMRFELTMLGIVLVYCALVFAELAIDDPQLEELLVEEGMSLKEKHDAFLKVDLVFLLFFTIEILVKLYGFGLAYLKDLFNVLDAAIVTGSLADRAVRPARGHRLTGSHGSARSYRRHAAAPPQQPGRLLRPQQLGPGPLQRPRTSPPPPGSLIITIVAIDMGESSVGGNATPRGKSLRRLGADGSRALGADGDSRALLLRRS